LQTKEKEKEKEKESKEESSELCRYFISEIFATK
jgi:hypothetical protein